MGVKRNIFFQGLKKNIFKGHNSWWFFKIDLEMGYNQAGLFKKNIYLKHFYRGFFKWRGIIFFLILIQECGFKKKIKDMVLKKVVFSRIWIFKQLFHG